MFDTEISNRVRRLYYQRHDRDLGRFVLSILFINYNSIIQYISLFLYSCLYRSIYRNAGDGRLYAAKL